MPKSRCFISNIKVADDDGVSHETIRRLVRAARRS